jgi:hypothetical protein
LTRTIGVSFFSIFAKVVFHGLQQNKHGYLMVTSKFLHSNYFEIETYHIPVKKYTGINKTRPTVKLISLGYITFTIFFDMLTNDPSVPERGQFFGSEIVFRLISCTTRYKYILSFRVNFLDRHNKTM